MGAEPVMTPVSSVEEVPAAGSANKTSPGPGGLPSLIPTFMLGIKYAMSLIDTYFLLLYRIIRDKFLCSSQLGDLQYVGVYSTLVVTSKHVNSVSHIGSPCLLHQQAHLSTKASVSMIIALS